MIGAGSPIATLGVRVISPVALVVAAHLFFAGHNRPGGGFAAGLVVGAVVALRTLAGLQSWFGAASLLGAGGALAAAVAVAPVAVGEALLDQAVVSISVPVLGTVKTGSALLFDAGVTLVVVGLVVALLDGLGTTSLSTDPSEPEAAP